MTSYTNISRWLKSGEYRSQLDSVLTKIVRECDHSDSEAHKSSIFEMGIYYLVRLTVILLRHFRIAYR